MINFYNKSAENIKVNWDGIVMKTNETDKKIQHIRIIDGEYFVIQPPSIFLPKSGYTDIVVFADSIYYRTEDGEAKMKIKDMFPRVSTKKESDAVWKLLGQRITLIFPIEINNMPHSWTFNFLIADIISKRELSAGDVISLIDASIWPPSF
jgi:hypothetical protein